MRVHVVVITRLSLAWPHNRERRPATLLHRSSGRLTGQSGPQVWRDSDSWFLGKRLRGNVREKRSTRERGYTT
ncbi:hypothetical protein PanWU01x14_081500 [Parasponia andersonii]|uniref:Uncharacterized protein n=1 Tax=Parasponia andersonii TaxID=3476 RepID=A0A2P5DB22_PARAD|nr:hypothetical protein PanWU01x14_081500 [Parasponia andersonii]